MKPFVKNKGNDVEAKQNVSSKGLLAGYKRIQGGWANWMRRRTEHFSQRTWIVLLTLFMLSTSAYSIYIAVSAITGKGGTSITVTPIKKLKHATETGETHLETVEVSETEYNHIKKFRMYMDSLARSPSGKSLYDSINIHRPGLMDSLELIEQLYQRKIKK